MANQSIYNAFERMWQHVIANQPPVQIQSDWNQNDETSNDYIKNRPFYSIVGSEKELKTVTFDGDLTGREYVEIGDNTLYMVKLSDDIPDVTDFLGTEVILTSGARDGVYSVDESTLSDSEKYAEINENSSPNGVTVEKGRGYVLWLFLYVVQEDMELVVLPDLPAMKLSKGVWTMYLVADNTYFKSVSYNYFQEELKQIDEKYIPDTIARKEYIHNLFVSCTQAEYDALVEAGTVDPNKYYMIVG